MEENGVSDLIRTDEKLSLNSTDFQTRIYTAVGRLGVHAGETDGAWSWTATKMMLIFSPALAGIAVGGGLVAHPISSIIANEEKRVSSPLWKLIGDASDTTDPLYLTMAKACKYNKPSSRLMPPMIPYLTMNTLSS